MIVKIHRTMAFFLLAFIVLHLGSHLLSLAGPQAHLATLPQIRPLYRGHITEPLLLALLGVQMVLGFMLVWRRYRIGIDAGWSRLQIASGLYIAFFLVMHVSAALLARYGNHLDTNFWWPASTLAHPILRYFFYPYYFLAVTALFIHIAAALHFHGRHPTLIRAVALTGPIIALLILVGIGGWLHDFSVPTPYMDAFTTYPGASSF